MTATRTRRSATTTDTDTRLAELHATLDAQVTALRTSDDWRAWLASAARFHDYSFGNVLLITAQCPNATRVAGYKAWQSMGRQVRKGERGLMILAPCVVAKTKDEHGHPLPKDERTARVVGFRVSHVWDISQTDGEPLPEPELPALLDGEAPEGMWDALTAQVEAAGLTVVRGDCGAANGVTDFHAGTVTVRPDVSDAQAVKTLAHELAHVMLHRPQDTARTATCRDDVEVEAESVAFLVAAINGLDTSAYSFPYIAGWAKDDEAAKAAGTRVMATARKIVDAFTPAGSVAVAA
jgi:DNA primase